jgi:nicotinamidase/pyrazinamidase
MKTLIIVDVQNDFLPGGALEVADSAGIMEVINGLQNEFELVIATQDWHPIDHMSFASNHPGKKIFEKIQLDGQEQILWPNHCVQNSPGAQFSSHLKTSRIEAIFRKGTDPKVDSYSAFYDNDHKRRTGLAGYLKDRQALELYFCGLAADFCVYYSILDALEEDFNCHLFLEATAAINKAQFENIQQALSQRGVRLISDHTTFWHSGL